MLPKHQKHHEFYLKVEAWLRCNIKKGLIYIGFVFCLCFLQLVRGMVSYSFQQCCWCNVTLGFLWFTFYNEHAYQDRKMIKLSFLNHVGSSVMIGLFSFFYSADSFGGLAMFQFFVIFLVFHCFLSQNLIKTTLTRFFYKVSTLHPSA